MKNLSPINLMHFRIIPCDATSHQSKTSDVQNAAMHETIRRTIRQYIAQHGITERQLAHDCGVVQSTFNRFMTGVTDSLSIENLQRVASYMSMTVSELIGEVPYPTDRKTIAVMHAMEAMPEFKKDMLVAASAALAQPDPPKAVGQ